MSTMTRNDVVAWCRPIKAETDGEGIEAGEVLDLQMHPHSWKPEGEGWLALTLDSVKQPVNPRVRNLSIQALASEVVQAVKEDEAGDGCDLSAGLFGPSTTALLRRIVDGYLAHPQQPAEQPRGEQHPDDAAVDAFATAMKSKLADARAKGRGGWNNDEPGMQQRLSNLLRTHVEKGDPRDVANFAMFLHQRGESILPKPEQSNYPEFPDSSNPERAMGYAEVGLNHVLSVLNSIDNLRSVDRQDLEYAFSVSRRFIRTRLAEPSTQPKPEQAVGDGVEPFGYVQDCVFDRYIASEKNAMLEVWKLEGAHAKTPIYLTPRPAVATPAEVTDVISELGRMAVEGGVTMDAHDMAIMCSQVADRISALATRPSAVGVPDGIVVERIDMGRGDERYIGTANGTLGMTVADGGSLEQRLLFAVANALLAAAPEIAHD